jgi:glycerol-3-phosphate acyltransferase PlsY
VSFFNFGLLIFAYILGSINSAILICWLFRLPSPRSVGSGNPGTTNVLRIGGKLPAVLTLTFDILKGLIPVVVAKCLGADEFIVAFVALYAVLGHVFPIFFGFKGGKGVATLIGVLFGFCWIVGLIFVVTWLIIAAITRYSSLSALVATVVACSSVIFLAGIKIAMPFLIIAVIVLVKHKDNIRRLLNREESKIGDKTKK